MQQIAIVGLDGIVFASYLFLVSAGLTFIYGVMRILNVAHGSLYGLGAVHGSLAAAAALARRRRGPGVTRS